MSLYYRGTEIREIDDALYAAWVAAGNPKALDWQPLPVQPEHDPQTHAVRWDGARVRIEFERGVTDADSDSWDTATEANVAADGTSGNRTTVEITCTNIDSIVAGDPFRVRIGRVGTDGTNDTASDDMELVSVELRAA